MIKRRNHRPVLERLALAGACLLLAGASAGWDLTHRANQVLYDSLLWLERRAADDQVVIVAIDEDSLARLGRWPWSRRVHARLIERLTAAGARVVGLDIILADPDVADPAADTALAEAIRANGRTVLVVYPEKRPGGGLTAALPLPALADAAAALAHVDVELDSDSVLRSAFLRAGMGGQSLPILPLAMLQMTEPWAVSRLPGERNTTLAAASTGEWVRDYRVLVPFSGPPGHYSRISYADVLEDDSSILALKGRLVLVGATATGLGTALPTPVSGHAQAMPGVEYHANLLDALRGQRVLVPMGDPGSLALVIGLVLLPALLYPRLSPRATLLAAGALPLLVVAISALSLHFARLWFPPAVPLGVLLVSSPLWHWRRLEAAIRSLFEEQERSNATLGAVGEAIISTDAQGIVVNMNPAAEAIIGQSASHARGHGLDGLLAFQDERGRPLGLDPVAQCLVQDRPVRLQGHRLLLGAGGVRRAVNVSAHPVHDERGTLIGVVLALDDVTQTLALARQTAYQATHDALTQLPNRVLLQDRLDQAIAHAGRTGATVAILFVDLDGFRRINEGLGQASGDKVLGEIARRLQSSERLDDTLARWGADEFILVLGNLADPVSVGGAAQRLLRILAQPHRFGGKEFVVTGSVGISLFPMDGTGPQDLLTKAEAAAHRAQLRGGDHFQYYTGEINDWTAERLALEQDLRRAIEGEGLEVFYQPQISLSQGRIVGVEALVRWRHRERGMIAPSGFIPLAEETGLIHPLGQWVLEQACRQAHIWHQAGIGPLQVAVNVSPRQFAKDNIGTLVANTLRETGLPSGLLKVEITESLFVSDVKRAAEILHELHALGVGISIDDFGTGYSSLSYLKRFPIDQLKIDQSFVRNVTLNRDDAAITQAVIALAHSLELQVIAEGVESESQLEFLRERGCDGIQGYYFSPPLPLEQATALLRRPCDLGMLAAFAARLGTPARERAPGTARMLAPLEVDGSKTQRLH